MPDERRRFERRRFLDRRAGAEADVTRAEHENLYAQVAENVQALRRLEAKLDALTDFMERRFGLKHAG